MALVASLSVTGCKDFLDISPDERLSVEDIFSNRVYTNDFLSHTYSWTPNETRAADSGGAYRNPYTAGCSEMECAYGAAYGHLINNGGWNTENVETQKIWAETYMALRKVNMFLENVDNCPADEDQIRHWKGEAHFLRAWFTFLTFRAYGPMPIVDHTFLPADDMLSVVRSSADEVADFIAKECDLAAEYLSDKPKWEVSDYGRATSIAALALKSRVLLYIASPFYNGNTEEADLKNLDGKQLISQTYDPAKWERAAEAAKVCLEEATSKGYALYEKYLVSGDYVTNFQQIFCDNWNDEIIWARWILDTHHFRCSDPVSFSCFSIFDPTQEMVDAFEMEDGSTPIIGYTDNGLNPIINEASGYKDSGFTDTADDSVMKRWQAGVCNMYVRREPRFYASINFAGAIWKYDYPAFLTSQPHTLEFWYSGIDGKSHAGSDYCKTGYNQKKCMNPAFQNGKYEPAMTWHYIRLAEIYLNYAEAANEAYGPTAEVYAAVNRIRNRAGLPNLAQGLSQAEMRERIRHERQIELCFEVHRFFDVRRWKIAPETEGTPVHGLNIMKGENMQDPEFYQRVKIEDRVFISPKHYLFPIYQKEIEKHTDRGLVQNLGWTTEISED